MSNRAALQRPNRLTAGQAYCELKTNFEWGVPGSTNVNDNSACGLRSPGRICSREHLDGALIGCISSAVQRAAD